MVPADAAIVHMRRLLLTAARDMAAGTEPPPLPSVARMGDSVLGWAAYPLCMLLPATIPRAATPCIR